MLFTSLPFVLFFACFFLLYWVVFNKNLVLQNLLILAGSYFFYAWWDWHFVFFLAGSSLVSYILGIQIYKSKEEKYRKLLVWAGLLVGFGSLLFFKYAHNVLLPLGISFYTFRMMSYLLDINRGKTAPTTDWVVYFSYVAFFPCLISGPIDRPNTLIPQLEKKRVFDYSRASDGMRQILWGLFKKIVIANNCAVFTSAIFENYKTLPASSLLFGAFLSTIQVYADFSGYSDMAIGLSSLIGFKVTRNFNYPFFAQNIEDFWRRWHISLTSWLTDYVFTPLAIYFRDYGEVGLILAILINFTAIGIWHGPNWTFVLFGFLNGCYFIPLVWRGGANKRKNGAKMAGTFILVMFTFVIFRSDSLSQAFDYYRRLFSPSIFSRPVITEKVNTLATLVCIAVLLLAEWLQRDQEHALRIDFIKSWSSRAVIYYSLLFIILTFSATKSTDFIYFKF